MIVLPYCVLTGLENTLINTTIEGVCLSTGLGARNSWVLWQVALGCTVTLSVKVLFCDVWAGFHSWEDMLCVLWLVLSSTSCVWRQLYETGHCASSRSVCSLPKALLRVSSWGRVAPRKPHWCWAEICGWRIALPAVWPFHFRTVVCVRAQIKQVALKSISRLCH